MLFSKKREVSEPVIERGIRMPTSDEHPTLDLVDADGVLVAEPRGVHSWEPWLELDWSVVSEKFREDFLAAGNGEDA